AYGVSPAMRQRVEETIERLGYRPRTAARVMRGQSFTIGFETPNVSHGIHSLVIDGAADELAGSAYQLVVVPGLARIPAQQILEALVDRQVDGIIATASEVPASSIERLARHTPIVVLGRHDDSPAFDTIINDDVAGTDLVMDHLLELGHTRIAHLTIHPSTDQSPHFFRLNQYLARMIGAGLTPNVHYVEETDAGAYGVAAALLATTPRPTAIFAGHDSLAMGVLRASAEAGLDPSTLSVVGYDNIELAGHPLISLTTVDLQGAETGRLAIKLILERVNGRTEARHECFQPQLRIRRSSGPAAG
ncbi:MAG: LacI family DNA-binding transcriptional regulator, partial [Micropruina sp.]